MRVDWIYAVIDYDDMRPRNDSTKGFRLAIQIAVVVTCLCVTIWALHYVTSNPEVVDAAISSIERRKEYAAEANRAKKEAAEYKSQMEQLERKLEQSDATITQLQDELDNAGQTRDELLSQLDGKGHEIDEMAEQVAQSQQDRQDAESQRDEALTQVATWEQNLKRRWHLSVGGIVSHPVAFDDFTPGITGVLGVGRGNLQVLGGVGIDLSGNTSISLGVLWTW